jgi:cell division transport system ATP-binding protein
MADPRGIALGYEPPADRGGEGRLWIPVGGSHRVVADRERAGRLRDMVLDLMPEPGGRLVVLGTEVGAVDPAERAAVRARVAFLPARGGLISHLNAWENIALPLGFHHPERLHGSAERVLDLLAGFGIEPRAMLAKLPDEMTLSEKRAAGCVRMLLEAPELVLAEDVT